MGKFNDVFHHTSSLDKDTQPSTPGSSRDTWLFTPGSDKSTRLTTPGSDKGSPLDVMKLHAALEREQGRNGVEQGAGATEDHDPSVALWPRLLEGVMKIVKQDRQAGLARSMAPDPRNMTAHQFILEALRDKRWPTRLQEQGIPVNRQTLDLLHTNLFKDQSASPRESNEAIRNFKDVAKQLGYKALKMDEVGLHGGIVGTYYQLLDAYESRTAKFIDSEGNSYVFNKGEYDQDIALQMQDWLTKQETYNLLRGSQIEGWTCDVETDFFVKVDYYTDASNPVHALMNVADHYESFTIDDHMVLFPDHPPIEAPTSRYNCFAIFIGEQGYVPGKNGQIADIIRDNEYYAVRLAHVQVGDLAFYYGPEEFPSDPYNNREELWLNEPPHIAEVVGFDDEGNILVSNKPGDYGRLPPLGAYDPAITSVFGEPVFARTDRPMGHRLHETPPLIPESD